MKKHHRHKKRSYLAPLLVAVLALVGAGLAYLVLSEPDPIVAAPRAAPDATAKPPAERTAALPPLKLPADDAAHGSAMEWWYYSGILDAQGGGRYAFHVAVFVANALVKHTVMHVALTDLQTGKRYTSQSRTGGLPAGQSSSGFDFRQDGWQVAGSGPVHQLRMSLGAGVSLSLDLRDAAPVVAHRAVDSQTPGLLDFGESGISYYYSRPRMAATGELRLAGQQGTVQVHGPVWFDHQWGEFDVTRLGWNWLALHLSDGSDVMVYELFDQNGRSVTTTGTLSNASGSRPLAPGEVELTPLRRWASPKSQVVYAVEWKLKLPAGELRVRPFFDDSEFDAGASSANIYWEGPVKVEGSVQGEGFLELSGYERLKAPAAR